MKRNCSYEKFLEELARNAGIENPSRQDISKLDRNRKGKGSNKEWKSPNDLDSGIMKMKDGRTHLAHKVEHAVDLETEKVGSTNGTWSMRTGVGRRASRVKS